MANNDIKFDRYRFDVVVIGAGGAGLRAAVEARQAGLRVAIVQDWDGAVLSPAMWNVLLEAADHLVASAGLRRIDGVNTELPHMGAAWSISGMIEIRAALGDMWPACADDLTPEMRAGLQLTEGRYGEAERTKIEARRAAVNLRMSQIFEEVDLVITATNPDIAFPAEGRAEYIEPGGTSFEYQFKRLEALAMQINELGLSAVLGQKLTAETAEAKRINRSQGDSTMMVIAQNMQDMIDNCLQFHAQYLGQNEAAGSSHVNRDFMGTRLDPQEINSLLQLYTAGTITQETLLQQLSDGEVLGDDFDVEEELDATANAGMDLQPARQPDQLVDRRGSDDRTGEAETPGA